MSDASLPDDLSQWPTDPYELFGIGRSSGIRDLRRAYAALIRKFKPEHYPQHFRRIRDAYETLEWQSRWRERGISFEASGIGDEITEAASEPPQSGSSDDQIQNPTPRHFEIREPQQTQKPRSDDDIDRVWRRAIKDGNDWQAVYRQHVQVAERAATDEVLFCRLYWLLTVAPHVDAQRKPVDWLATGLSRIPSTPRLLTLYFQELNRRPAEVLQERSRALLTQPRPIWELAELARQRWRALRVLGRLEEVAVDLRLLSGAYLSAREEWVQLLITAVEVLVWSAGEAVAFQLGECLREIEQMTDVHLGLGGLLDRQELLLVIAGEYREYKDWLHPDFPNGLFELLPELWLNSDAAQLRLVEILESWVDHPETALDSLEYLNSVCHVTLMYLSDLFTALAPRHVNDANGARRRSIENLINTHEWTLYRSCRDQLCQYCLHTGIWLDDILEVMFTDSRYADLAAGPAANYLRNDLPLKCLLAGHRAFWR